MSANANFDPHAYLTRLRWNQAPPSVSLEGLSALLRAHMLCIPFENLEVLSGSTPRLDLPSVQAKLVTGKRGGYCFEHGVLFSAALAHFGFQSRSYLARVTLHRSREQAPRTHHFMQVTLDGQDWLVDPGFGGLAPDRPIPFAAGTPSRGPYHHHLVRDGIGWTLRAQADGNTLELWNTQLEEALPVDFEMGNHYTATHPQSLFVQHLLLRALTPDGHVSVLDRDVTLRQGDCVRRWSLPDRAALDALLRDHFDIELSNVWSVRVSAIPEWPKGIR